MHFLKATILLAQTALVAADQVENAMIL